MPTQPDVTADVKPTGVSTETPVPAEPVSPQSETPQPAASDVSPEAVELQKRVQKYEQDMNRMKSTFQRRETEAQKNLDALERRHRNEMETLRRSLLDTDALKEYEASTKESRLTELEISLQDAQKALAEERSMRGAFDAFISRGVPANVLSNAAEEGGLQAMSAAAWDWLFQEKERLAVENSTIKSKKANPEPPPQAPPVATPSPAGSAASPTWDDLIKKYGSMEKVFDLVEARRLPPSIIPIKK